MHVRSYISKLLILSKSATFLLLALFAVQLQPVELSKKRIAHVVALESAKRVCVVCNEDFIEHNSSLCRFLPIINPCLLDGGPGVEPSPSPKKDTPTDGGPGTEPEPTPTPAPAPEPTGK